MILLIGLSLKRNLNLDIEKLTEAVTVLKKELDQHRSAQMGFSRSSTCVSPLNPKLNSKSPILPSIIPKDQVNKPKKTPCIMFTKLDAERNIRRLSRAVNRGLLNDKAFEVNFLFVSISETYLKLIHILFKLLECI